jgi:hypothetical protein
MPCALTRRGCYMVAVADAIRFDTRRGCYMLAVAEAAA